MSLGFGKRALLLAAVVTAWIIPAAAAEKDDKSGVSPTTVSLPSGPGSIEGLGESFQPMLNTGTTRYAVKIALPPGTAGHAPSLKLQYESGFGDGPAGIGWVYGPGAIARQTDKGIPRYVDGPNSLDDDADGEIDEFDEADTFLGPDGEELVRLSDGTYRARIEGGFSRYRREGEHWEVDLRSGTLLQFGLTPQGRVTGTSGAKVFRWLLERSTDVNGNTIEYSWAELPGSDNQKYLKEIRYGPGSSPWAVFTFVSFTYGERPDWRTDYRSGFLVRTAHRLTGINVGIQGVLPPQCAAGDHNDDGTEDALISRYVLEYDDSSNPSFLVKVTRFGSDGVNWLPPVSFGYSVFDPPLAMSAAEAVIGSERAPFSVMDSELVDLIDLNRDGLADILQTDFHGSVHIAYLNRGEVQRGGRKIISWEEGRQIESEDGLAGFLHLAEDRVSLADMNGDGSVDLTHHTQGGDVHVFPNRGDLSWGARQVIGTSGAAPPAPFSLDWIQTADLDFDKRMDVVMSTEAGHSVWFNYPDGGYSREVRTPGALHRGEVMLFSDPGVQLADMNGDRLSDVVRVMPDHLAYAPSMGHGIFAEAVEMPIPDVVLTAGADGQIARAKLTDVNGDGLADLVLERAAAGELWCWLNRGTDVLSQRIVVTGMPVQYGPDTAVRWADMNGNGTTDLVYADSRAFSRIRIVDLGLLLGGTAHPNLLTRVGNGLGVTTSIRYRSSTDFAVEASREGEPWDVSVPFPVQVVAEVETTTGLDVDLLSGEDRYLKYYRYRDGFYEDRERAFRGFAMVTVTEPGDASAPDRVSRHEFLTGGPDGEDNDGDGDVDEVSPEFHREEDALKGLARSVEIRTEEGQVFSREENSWRVGNLHVSPEGIEVRFAYNTQSDTLVYEKTATPETIRTGYLYDDFGNVTEESAHGALSITGDEVFTNHEYINDTSRWILGVPARETVTDKDGLRVAETISYYDGEDFAGLPFGQLTKGYLTHREGWVEGDTWVDLVRSAYDSWGNVITTLDPNGGRRSVLWETDFHIYPLREAIEVGGGKPDLTVSAEYNVGLGVATASTGFNGHRSEYGYDVFGRLTSIVLPGDLVDLPTQQFSYTMADPSKGLLYEYDAEGALTLISGSARPGSVSTRAREVSGATRTFDSIGYVDGLGRSLATVTESEAGFIVSETVLFNAHGDVRRAFLPYEVSIAEYAPPNATHPAVETHYDAAGRMVLSITPPDAHDTLTSASTTYLPLMKTVTDENGHPKDFLNDGLGRLVEVHEHNGPETYVTRYAYDPVGGLLEIVDAQENTKTIQYDGLARKRQMDDPDRGRTSYEYDPSGNLIRTVDNRGQERNYSYDAANRMLAEYHLDGSGPAPAVAYYYDDPGSEYPAALNTRGRLAWVEDRSGAQFLSYDARGNVAWTVKRITDDGVTTDYLFESEFDALGRVVSSTWPDGDSVQYTYNNRSLIETIPGIVDDIDYHPSGAISGILYGNGVQTDYVFDPRTRMIGLSTAPEGGGGIIQDLEYNYDGVSNITSIKDGRAAAFGYPSNATQSFLYDGLHRLTRADGPAYGAMEFQYDAIGNMVFKRSPEVPDPQHIDDPFVNLGAMTYGGAGGASGRGPRLPGEPPGPHAVTGTTSGLVFGYDDNGNMTSSDGDLYESDFNDRLARVQTAMTDSRYVYDHAGQRVIKRVTEDGTESVTYYVSDGYEIREDTPVKYVFAGARRVARIEERVSVGEASQELVFVPGWNLFSLTVEPSNPAVEAVLAPVAGKYTGVWGYDAALQAYVGSEPAGETADLTELHAHRGYLIHITGECALTVTGQHSSEDQSLLAGWNLIGHPSSRTLPVEEALTSVPAVLESLWTYDTASGDWQHYLPGSEPFLNTLRYMSPGGAYWAKLSGDATLTYLEQETKTFFFHPDHLGSSSVVTDDTGAVVERTEFYPFGRERYGESSGFDSAYTFTGKELDQETRLMYFEARHYDPVIGRFLSVDPLHVNPEGAESARDPQLLGLYSYAVNRPTYYVDPTGEDIIIAYTAGDAMERRFAAVARALKKDIETAQEKAGVASEDRVKIHVVKATEIEETRKKIHRKGSIVSALALAGHGAIDPKDNERKVFLSAGAKGRVVKTVEELQELAQISRGGAMILMTCWSRGDVLTPSQKNLKAQQGIDIYGFPYKTWHGSAGNFIASPTSSPVRPGGAGRPGSAKPSKSELTITDIAREADWKAGLWGSIRKEKARWTKYFKEMARRGKRSKVNR